MNDRELFIVTPAERTTESAKMLDASEKGLQQSFSGTLHSESLVTTSGIADLFTIKIYVWLPTGCTGPCRCGNQGCKPQVEGNYGHAAMSIPYVEEVESFLKEYANEIKKCPLYLSLGRKKFNNTEHDREFYGGNYHAYVLPLVCTKKEIITLWKAFLEKNPTIKEKPLSDVGGYNVPSVKIGENDGYNIIFSFYANSSSKEDNCTTFIVRLLKQAGIEGLKHHCSPGFRAGSTGILQALSSVFAGYNLGIATEICAVCLGKQTVPIRAGAITSITGATISIIIIVATLLGECFCLPFSRQRWPKAVKQITQRLRTPLSVLISLPLFLINLGIFIYIVYFHSQHHRLIDDASWIGIVVGLIAGVSVLFVNAYRHIHTDTFHYVVRPEVLLDLFPEEVIKLDPSDLFIEEVHEQIFSKSSSSVTSSSTRIFSLTTNTYTAVEQDNSEIFPVTKAIKSDSLITDKSNDETIELDEQKRVQKSNVHDTVEWNGYCPPVFPKSSGIMTKLDSSEEEAGDEDSATEVLQPY